MRLVSFCCVFALPVNWNVRTATLVYVGGL